MSEPCCPRCREPVRLPAEISAADAAVRCPWCGDQFALAEVTAKLPPMLEWVAADADASQAAVAGGSLYDLHADGSWDESFEDPADSDAAVIGAGEAFHFAPDPTVQPSATALAGVNLATRPRAQRRVSLTKTLVQWIGGGVAGIAIALAVLYAVGKPPDLGIWPFDGSATFSRRPPQQRPFELDQRSVAGPPENRELPLPDFQTLEVDADEDSLR